MMTAILAVFAGGAAPAMAQSGEDAPFDASNSLLSQVVSVAGADIRTSDVRIKDAEEYFGRLVLASGDHVYGIDGLLLSRDDNGYRILADRMTINRTEPDSPVLAISDIEARLAPGFFWRSPADIFCAWTDSMQELRIGNISGRLPLAPAGGEVQTALGGIEWTGQGGNGCRLTGTVKVADITVGGATEAGFDITSLDLGLDIPVGQEAARSEDGRSTIRAAFGAFSLYTDRRDLIQGLNDGTVELAGTAQSALPAVLIASRFDIFDRERNDLALEMDVWNLLALMRADIRWDFRQMQTMSATVIPAEMTANFRSVGLSILSSSASGLMRMRAGQVSVSSTSDHVGLGRAEIGAAFTIAPHGREALARADAREEGFDPPRAVAVNGFSLVWDDAGFNTVFSGLFGLTPDRWFQISRQMMEESAQATGTIWIGGIPDAYHQAIEGFFRESEEGAVGFAIAPTAPVALPDAMRALSEDPAAFIRVMKPSRIAAGSVAD